MILSKRIVDLCSSSSLAPWPSCRPFRPWITVIISPNASNLYSELLKQLEPVVKITVKLHDNCNWSLKQMNPTERNTSAIVVMGDNSHIYMCIDVTYSAKFSPRLFVGPLGWNGRAIYLSVVDENQGHDQLLIYIQYIESFLLFVSKAFLDALPTGGEA